MSDTELDRQAISRRLQGRFDKDAGISHEPYANHRLILQDEVEVYVGHHIITAGGIRSERLPHRAMALLAESSRSVVESTVCSDVEGYRVIFGVGGGYGL